MQNPTLVREVNCACHGNNDLGSPPWRQRTTSDCLFEAAAFDQPHGEVMLPLDAADVVDRNDLRMFEVSRSLRLRLEPLEMRVRGPWTQGDHLEGDDPIEACLPRAIDYTLAAPSDLLNQFIVTKLAPVNLSARFSVKV